MDATTELKIWIEKELWMHVQMRGRTNFLEELIMYYRTNNSESHFTGLVPRNKLGHPQNLKNFRNAEKRTT